MLHSLCVIWHRTWQATLKPYKHQITQLGRVDIVKIPAWREGKPRPGGPRPTYPPYLPRHEVRPSKKGAHLIYLDFGTCNEISYIQIALGGCRKGGGGMKVDMSATPDFVLLTRGDLVGRVVSHRTWTLPAAAESMHAHRESSCLLTEEPASARPPRSPQMPPRSPLSHVIDQEQQEDAAAAPSPPARSNPAPLVLCSPIKSTGVDPRTIPPRDVQGQKAPVRPPRVTRAKGVSWKSPRPEGRCAL